MEPIFFKPYYKKVIWGGNKIKTIDRNRRINTINNDTENDIINNKSFILDLNNVIPINDNKLIQSVNMQLIPNRNNEEN